MMVAFLSVACAALAGCRRQAPEDLYQAARGQFERGEFMAAAEAADRGYRHYQDRQPEWAARFRVLQGQALVWRGLNKDALALLQPEVPASLTSDPVAVRRKLAQALAFFYLQNYEDAQRRLAEGEQLATQYEPNLLGEVAQTRGILLRDDYAAAETSFRRALEIARQHQQRFVEANALGNLGVVYMQRQRFSEAIDWFEACLKLWQAVGARTLQAKTLGNLGWNYYMMGDIEKAVSMSSEAESLSAQLGMRRDQQIWLSNLGLAYADLGDYASAEAHYLRALAIARDLDDKSLTAICLNNLAQLALNARQLDKAQEYNREALALKRAIHNRPSELYSLVNEARIAKDMGEFHHARELLQEVIDGAGEDRSLRWEAEAESAGVYVLENKAPLAERQFRKTIAGVDEGRRRLSKEEYRFSFLASATRFYNSYIDFLVSRGRAVDALAVAEHSRSRTLAEGLGIAPSRASFVSADLQPQRIARRQRATILVYWLKPERSYLWVISPAKVSLFQLPPEAKIKTAVEAYRKALLGTRDVRETGNADGQKLYQMLVAPAQKLIPPGARVEISADGALHNLNFETLLVPAPQMHYWIEDVVISNAGSLALLAASRNGGALRHKQLLLMGDPRPASAEFPELTHAAGELQNIENHFAPDRRIVLSGREATPDAYAASRPGRFSYIHFVAHGTASRTSPLDSAVVLSRGAEAYKLYAREIVKTPLQADLVTISTCYGAGTRNYTGEGLVGLSWAFLRAGAHNVIAALWEANDASTPQLMDALYAEIVRGRDPAMALRSAKLAMLHSGTVYRKPIYWAPFQLYTGS